MNGLVRPSPHFATYALYCRALLPHRADIVALRHHVMSVDGPAPEKEMKLGDELEHELTDMGMVLEGGATLEVFMTNPGPHLEEEDRSRGS